MRARAPGGGRTETAHPDNATPLTGRMKSPISAASVPTSVTKMREGMHALQERRRRVPLRSEPGAARERHGATPVNGRKDRSQTSRPASMDAVVGPKYRPSNDCGWS